MFDPMLPTVGTKGNILDMYMYMQVQLCLIIDNNILDCHFDIPISFQLLQLLITQK